MAEETGIVYIATGERFVRETIISAERAKKFMPNVPITLMTDCDVESTYFDSVLKIKNPRHDFGDQVFQLERTPYTKTIFLDSDIYLDDSIEDLFTLLDKFDLAICQNRVDYSSNRINVPSLDCIPESFPEYNTGVIAFHKNKRVEQFLASWKEYYSVVLENDQIHNQAACRAALYQSELQIATLPSNYNCVFRRPGCVNGKVKVFHGRILDIEGPGADKRIDVEKAATRINKDRTLRTHHPLGDKVTVVEPHLLTKFVHSLKDLGPKSTFDRGASLLKSKIER